MANVIFERKTSVKRYSEISFFSYPCAQLHFHSIKYREVIVHYVVFLKNTTSHPLNHDKWLIQCPNTVPAAFLEHSQFLSACVIDEDVVRNLPEASGIDPECY